MTAITSPVLYEVNVPESHRWNMASASPVPVFDKSGRGFWLRFHADGTVTWQLRDRDGAVLEPDEYGRSRDADGFPGREPGFEHL